MISTIGFLSNTTETKALQKFIPDENIKKRLDYFQLPLISDKGERDDYISSDSEELPEIKTTDNILFCTPNSEEISNVAFYGYDDTEMFFHHDLLVFNTIIDSCRLISTNRYVAVATFEPDIMIYDFGIELPLLPQILLIGHEDAVTGIKNKEEKLMSCSQDKTTIEWDINELRIKERTAHDIEIERFDFEGNSLVFGAKTHLNINNESISLENELEQLRIKDNIVYVSDSEGKFTFYDIRNTSKAIFSDKIHEKPILDFCFAKDWIVTTSFDNKVKLWKNGQSGIELKATLEQNSTIFSLGYNEFDTEDEVFAGNAENHVFPIKLEELQSE
ncbi:rRNA-processing protein [Glugoides intestinalis]